MAEIFTAMISSTFTDLRDYRQEAILACLTEETFPLCMETLSAADSDSVQESLKLVDKADIYLGIFGHRYGTDSGVVVQGKDISITHQEYLRACDRGIPRLIFVMDKDCDIKIDMVDVKGDKAQKLQELKELIKKDTVVKTFKSPEDLRGRIVESLVNYYRELSAKAEHKYIPHVVERYDRDEVIGRKDDLASLNKWIIDKNSSEYNNSIYIIVAKSGMGKSLLAWKWFDSLTSKFWKGLTWWSLYQKGDFEFYLKQNLIHLIKLPKETVHNKSASESMSLLLDVLNKHPYLLVLDGLEYALEQGKSLSSVLDSSTVDTPIEKFLTEFSKLDEPQSRILITTTKFPEALKRINDEPREKVYRNALESLSNDEAVKFWEAVGLNVPLPNNDFLYLINRFNNHPLLIRALAGEIKHDQEANGNFQIWWSLNEDKPLGQLRDIDQWISKLLEEKLSQQSKEVLSVISAFSCPCKFDVLETLMEEKDIDRQALSTALRDLLERGLINRIDYKNNTKIHSYRIHQLVSEAAWEKCYTVIQRREMAERMFTILVNKKYYNDAYEIFIARLNRITFIEANNNLRIELLQKLFPKGLDEDPCITDDDINVEQDKKAIVIASLVRGYLIKGNLKNAIALSRNHITVREKVKDMIHAAKAGYYLCYELLHCGHLIEAEEIINKSLKVFEDENKPFWRLLCLKLLKHLFNIRGATTKALDIQKKINSTPIKYSDDIDDNDEEVDEINFINRPKEMIESIAAEVNNIENKLHTIVEDAKQCKSSGNYEDARNLLREVFKYEDYILINADAYLLLAEIERNLENRENTIKFANTAYELSLCDDTPYTYKKVFLRAKQIRSEYGIEAG